jgi:hypothetical protein
MSLLRWIGVIAGVISLIALAENGFDLTLGPLLIGVVRIYEGLMGRAIGMIEPFLIDLFVFVNAQFGWSLHLQPDWKHFFVLTLLYFAAFARQAFGDKLYGTALFESVIGIVIALACGVACGAVVASTSASGIAIALIPIVGIFLFGIADSLWGSTVLRPSTASFEQSFGRMVLDDVVRLGFTLMPVLFFSNPARLAVFGPLPSPGLAVLATVVPALAVYHLWAGSMERTPLKVTEWKSFLARGHTKVGLDILTGIGAATAILLLGT